MKRILLIAFNFVLILSASAQIGGFGGAQKAAVTGRVTATILDSLTKQPIDYATVSLVRIKDNKSVNGGVTDEKGKIILQNIAPGEYKLITGFMGYVNKQVLVTTTPEKPDMNAGNIVLRPTENVLKEVSVVGTKALIENKIDKVVYNAEQDITNAGGDATDVMRKVPMLSVDIDGNLQLRGSSAVKVLINGKPSGTMANSVADALKMIPAEEIKSVEVITSPSAKYDAEGSGGIINIITKKKAAEGINGNVNLAAGTRQNNGNFSLNGKRGRLGVTSNLGIMYSLPQDTRIVLFNENSALGTTTIQDGVSATDRWGYNGGVGLDYDFNSYHNISTNVRISHFKFETDGVFNGTNVFPGLTSSFSRTTLNNAPNNNVDWSVDYRKTSKKEGEEFSISGQASFGRNINEFTTTLDATGMPSFSTNGDNTGKNNEYTIQTDYVYPISKKVIIEGGLKGIFRDITSKYQNTTQDFDYGQNVGAGYAVITFPLTGKITAKAGLRAEYTDISGLAGNVLNFKNDYFNLFPSIIISQTLGAASTVKVTYNKRMQRPSLFYLNPFLNDADPQNMQQGNPALAPELSDNVEIGYSTYIKGSVINASFFYRNTNAIIESVFIPGQKLTTFLNVGTNQTFGMNIFGSYNPLPKWTLMANFGLNSYEVNDPVQNISTGTFVNYNVFGRSAIAFNGGWNTEMFVVINSNRRTFQGENGGIKIFGAAVKKEIWKKKATVGLNVLNPFARDLHIITRNSGTNFVQNVDVYYPIRTFGVNFSYKFGKLKFTESKKKVNNDDLKVGEQQQGGGVGGGGVQQ
ncbi:MAG: TonB-dependent receptor [Pedobacter sp.]|nr:MAG: TonB-dependent receptor [Pedobacter sp.]